MGEFVAQSSTIKIISTEVINNHSQNNLANVINCYFKQKNLAVIVELLFVY